MEKILILIVVGCVAYVGFVAFQSMIKNTYKRVFIPKNEVLFKNHISNSDLKLDLSISERIFDRFKLDHSHIQTPKENYNKDKYIKEFMKQYRQN